MYSNREQLNWKNIYNTLKGRIRLELICQDLHDCCLEFASGSLKILDIGGGSGRFADACLELGHTVTMLDCSEQLLALAKKSFMEKEYCGSYELVQADFLSDSCAFNDKFDLVVMHGSAEWMADPEKAIEKAISIVKANGCFSLLHFNKDRSMPKRGINGLLLEGESAPLRNKLTPPGARSPHELTTFLESLSVEILLQSGIRIFYRFFRQIDESLLSSDQWLEQEKSYYRKVPFSGLGEHTHFVMRCS